MWTILLEADTEVPRWVLMQKYGKTLSLQQAVTELIEPVFRENSIELVDVEYKKAGKTWTLRIFIDKSQGVTVDDCQKLSREIEDLIEVHELIAVPYVLEVSSPGLDRLLKKERDFLRNKGKQIQIKTFSPINDKKQFSGTIKNFVNEILFLEDNNGILEVQLDKIARARLIIKF